MQNAISDKTLKYESILYSLFYIFSIQLNNRSLYQSYLNERRHTISANLDIHIIISYTYSYYISGYSN